MVAMKEKLLPPYKCVMFIYKISQDSTIDNIIHVSIKLENCNLPL